MGVQGFLRRNPANVVFLGLFLIAKYVSNIGPPPASYESDRPHHEMRGSLTLICFCGVCADPRQIKTVGILQQDMIRQMFFQVTTKILPDFAIIQNDNFFKKD